MMLVTNCHVMSITGIISLAASTSVLLLMEEFHGGAVSHWAIAGITQTTIYNDPIGQMMTL